MPPTSVLGGGFSPVGDGQCMAISHPSIISLTNSLKATFRCRTLGIHFAHPSVVPGLELIEGRDCETWSCLLVTIRTSESMGQPMRCVRSEPCLSSVPALEECILASVI